eukprot:symbB.v1.2.007107.t3/scaffold430.1/size206084/2
MDRIKTERGKTRVNDVTAGLSMEDLVLVMRGRSLAGSKEFISEDTYETEKAKVEAGGSRFGIQRFIMHPDNNIRRIWTCLVVGLLVYTGTIFIYRLIFVRFYVPRELEGPAMGGLSSRFFGQPQFQVVVMGLDNAGKTTMLHTMKNRQGGQIEMTIPTVGLNVKTLEFQGSAKFLTLQAFDLGGRNNFRPLMRHWFAKTDGIIFVVDSNDRRRLEDAKFELHRILAEDNLYGKPLLVLANKQDLTGAAKMSDMVDGLSLHSLRNRRWYIEEIQRFQCWILLCISLVETVAKTGSGLWEGLDWLTNAMKKEAKKEAAPVPLPPALPALPTMPKKKVEKDVEDDVSTADTEDMMARAEIIG